MLTTIRTSKSHSDNCQNQNDLHIIHGIVVALLTCIKLFYGCSMSEV